MKKIIQKFQNDIAFVKDGFPIIQKKIVQPPKPIWVVLDTPKVKRPTQKSANMISEEGQAILLKLRRM